MDLFDIYFQVKPVTKGIVGRTSKEELDIEIMEEHCLLAYPWFMLSQLLFTGMGPPV